MLHAFQRIIQLGPLKWLKKIVGYEEVYAIAIRKKDAENDLSSGKIGKKPFEIFEANDSYWEADPLLFSFQGEDFLFTERYDISRDKGSLAVVKLKDKKSNFSGEVILSEEYHLSFPNVFEWNGVIYMIPETSEAHTINLYRGSADLKKWKLVASFHEDRIVDAVAIKIEQDHIVILASEYDKNDPLRVRYSQFKIEVRDEDYACIRINRDEQEYNLTDRNAGKLLCRGGERILPTQESTLTEYGMYLVFRKIDAEGVPIQDFVYKYSVNDIKILDKVIKRNLIGIHTYSSNEDVEIIDLRYYRFSISANYRRIKRKIRRLKAQRNHI